MYVLNVKKGNTINHPSVGKLEGGVAYEVSDKEALMLKNIINIVIFDKVVHKEKEQPVVNKELT